MTKKIAVILADGFEEIEAVVPSDVLKRLGCEVIHAGAVSKTVTGAHGFRIEAACTLKELDPDFLDAVFLPGGLQRSAPRRSFCTRRESPPDGASRDIPARKKWLPDSNIPEHGRKTIAESSPAKVPAPHLILRLLSPKLSAWRRKNFNN